MNMNALKTNETNVISIVYKSNQMSRFKICLGQYFKADKLFTR